MKIPQVSDEKRKLAIFRKCCLTHCWQETQQCKRPHSEWTEGQMTLTMLCPNIIIFLQFFKFVSGARQIEWTFGETLY